MDANGRKWETISAVAQGKPVGGQLPAKISPHEPCEEGGEGSPGQPARPGAEGPDQEKRGDGQGVKQEGIQRVGGAEIPVQQQVRGAQPAAGGTVQSRERMQGAARVEAVGGGIAAIEQGGSAEGGKAENGPGEFGCWGVVDSWWRGDKGEYSIINIQ